MNSITIEIKTVEEAPNYNHDGKGFKGDKLIKAIIVRNGTQGGNDTVDLQFEDQQGNRYIAMTTARLLKTVTDVCVVGK